jgi:hypothetical protein
VRYNNIVKIRLNSKNGAVYARLKSTLVESPQNYILRQVYAAFSGVLNTDQQLNVSLYKPYMSK